MSWSSHRFSSVSFHFSVTKNTNFQPHWVTQFDLLLCHNSFETFFCCYYIDDIIRLLLFFISSIFVRLIFFISASFSQLMLCSMWLMKWNRHYFFYNNALRNDSVENGFKLNFDNFRYELDFIFFSFLFFPFFLSIQNFTKQFSFRYCNSNIGRNM